MTTGSIKAVVFDLDDTLISEAEYQVSARAAVLRYISETVGLSIEQVHAAAEKAKGAPRSEYFQTLLAHLSLGTSAEIVAELITAHRDHRPRISFYPDVARVLTRLRQDGARLGVITDGYAIAQRRKLQAVEAERYFDAVVVSDELGRQYWKPHSLPFLTVARALRVEPHELMYVGDNPEKDFYVANELPITTVWIKRQDALKLGRPLRGGLSAHYEVSDLAGVEAVYTELKL